MSHVLTSPSHHTTSGNPCDIENSENGIGQSEDSGILDYKNDEDVSPPASPTEHARNWRGGRGGGDLLSNDADEKDMQDGEGEVMYSDIARNIDVCMRCYIRMTAAARQALSAEMKPHSFTSREQERSTKNKHDIPVVCDICHRKGAEFAGDDMGHAAEIQVEKEGKCCVM
jgi:Zn finger protein HypA/HybF involved in hydrogenase expression